MNTHLEYEYTGDITVSDPAPDYPRDPSIAAVPEAGGYVMVWQGSGDNELSEIHYKRINADGSLFDRETVIAVNDSLHGTPAVVVTYNFAAVAYVAATATGNELRLALVDVSTGLAFDDLFVAESIPEGESPAIASLGGGDLVVGWADADGFVHTLQYDYTGKLYPNSDVRIDDSFGATSPSIAAGPDGTYLVSYGTIEGNLLANIVYPELHQDPQVAQRIYDTYSTNSPAEIVTSGHAGVEGTVTSSVARLADGGFVVSWTQERVFYNAATDMNEIHGFDIHVQHLDANGNIDAEAVTVNTVTGITNVDAQVAALGDGGYIVVWRADNGYDTDIVARRFDAYGHPVDMDQFTVNQDVAGYQGAPAVAAQLAGTGFATVWADEGQVKNGIDPAIEARLEVNQITVFSSSESQTSAVSDGSAVNLDALIAVNDADFNQQLTWSVADGKQPANGTLVFTDAVALSGSQPGIRPDGSVTYTANPGFSGTDTFSVRVYDGHTFVDRQITVNVTAPSNPHAGNVAPGTPMLSGATDSGVQGDFTTNTNSVTYSGTAGQMANSQLRETEVYIDQNGNGFWDGEEEPGARGANIDGMWSGSFDVSGLADGSYTVHAANNWIGGDQYRSQTTLIIDRKGPSVAAYGMQDFDIANGPMTFTISYQDSGSGIDPLSIGKQNVIVLNSQSLLPLQVEVTNVSGNTVTYTAVPQDGAWDQAEAGTYIVQFAGGEDSVRDLAGNVLNSQDMPPPPVRATYTPPTGGTGETGNTAPGKPVLSPAYDSGAHDGIITNSDTVHYSGLAGTMADSGMTETEVYVDVNGNGRWDGEEEPGTFAPNVDGAYSGSIDVSWIADGTYTVYAENNWIGGEEYKSQTTLVLDRNGPMARLPQASDFDLRKGLTFSVTYDENGSGLDAQSIGVGNVDVINEQTLAALKVEVTHIAGNTVTYTASAQGEGWGPGSAGLYAIHVKGGEDGVRDLAGNTLSVVPQQKMVNATYSQPPVLGGVFSMNSIDDEHTALPFSGVTVSDPDSELVSIRIVYHGANGTLSGAGLQGEAGDYLLAAADPTTLQQHLQALVFTPAPVQSASAGEVQTTFTLTPRDSEGAGASNSLSQVLVKDAVPAVTPTPPSEPTPPTTPTTPTTPSEPADPVSHGTVDGVDVNTSTSTGTGGLANVVTQVPVIVSTRAEDPTTAHETLADIPLGVSGANGVKTALTVSLPTGTGMVVQSVQNLITQQQALLDLIARIESKTPDSSALQLRMTGQGSDFLGKLSPAALLQTATLTMEADATSGKQTILISGSSLLPANGGANASAIGLVIDASKLPSSTVLQLDNVDFAAIVGNATLRGGDGQNYVVGDDAVQNIMLGADDDILAGGGGNDTVGSAGGNDRLDGGSGDDSVVGGIGNDTVSGGTGNDVVAGGRSDQGAWNFLIGADGALSANHELALFAPGSSENVAASELLLAKDELSFTGAESARLVDLALLYNAAFGRAPDLSGINFWAGKEIAAKDVAAHMLQSAEWTAAGGDSLSDTAFVQKVYAQAFARTPDPEGLAFWLGKLDASAGTPAATRAEVLSAIALGGEHRAALPGADGKVTVASTTLGAETGWFANSGDDVLEGGAGKDLLVGGDGKDTVVYSGALAGYKIVLGQAGQVHVEDKANGDLDTIVDIEAGAFAGQEADLSFTLAPQAQLQTLGMLYQAVLDRSADLGGINWWAAKGLDTASLVSTFIGADEFHARFDAMDDAAFVNALYQASSLDAQDAGGAASWVDYLSTHSRAELIGAWVSNDKVIDAQLGSNGLWLV